MSGGNWITLGPITLRVGNKHLAKWGYARLTIAGLSFWSWSSDGNLHLLAYHPRSSITWLWYIALSRKRYRLHIGNSRFGQWHYMIPLGLGTLIIGRQNRMARK